MCINKEYNAGHTDNYGKIKRFNMDSLQDKANAFLPALKQTLPIHATSISLFANYRHPAQVIYEVITASKCMRFQCHLMQLYKYRTTNITKPIRNTTMQ